MSVLNQLINCQGKWQGTSRLQDPMNNIAEDSLSNLTLTPLLKSRFVRLDYDWSYQGTPQEGSFLIGYDSTAEKVTGFWIDSWHNSDKVMVCQGSANADGSISLLGFYPAPPGPDWGWRTTINPQNGKSLRLVMYNISPEGQEDVAVEADYARA